MISKKKFLICAFLLMSFSAFSVQNADPGKGAGGVQGNGGVQGGGGGAGPGGYAGGVGYGGGPTGLFAADDGIPQFGIRHVKPTVNGTCLVSGIGTGAWVGSPCEKLYGSTPITAQ